MKTNTKIGIAIAVVVVLAVAVLGVNTKFFQGAFKSFNTTSRIVHPDLTIDEIRLPAGPNYYSTYTITLSNRSGDCFGLSHQDVEVKLYPLYRLWSEPAGIQASIDANDIFTIFSDVDLCSNWTKSWMIGLPNDRTVRKLFPDGTLHFLAHGTLMTMQVMIDPRNKIAESNELNNFRLESVPMTVPSES